MRSSGCDGSTRACSSANDSSRRNGIDLIIDQHLGIGCVRVAAIDFENRSVRIFRSPLDENPSMMKKIEALSRAIASDGWTTNGVHRLIALVEEDGRETPAEERDLRAV